jgi:3-oxoacyl-[acyl-carrier-protein] synthase III
LDHQSQQLVVVVVLVLMHLLLEDLVDLVVVVE